MFNASYFVYDGIYSNEYGIQIASLDSQNTETTSVFAPLLETSKATRSKRFLHNGIKYEEAPTFQFSVLSEVPIDDLNRRKILSWLVGRNGFKPLKILQEDLNQYEYNCVFTTVDIIYVRGMCYGFQLSATFDSWFCYGKPTRISNADIDNNGIVTIYNKSDILDDYVYPSIRLKYVESEGVGLLSELVSEEANLVCSITNLTDNDSRVTKFYELDNNEVVDLDGETRVVKNSDGIGRLSCFNKNWLRLKNGKNLLSIALKGEIEIICPTYVMIGF